MIIQGRRMEPDRTTPGKLTIECKQCGKTNFFEQPYLYHAGFSDQGFLYNDKGTLTLVWNVTDPVLSEMFPGDLRWMLNPLNRRRFEKILTPAPAGDRWRFHNPARCTFCSKPILRSMLHSIHYVLYPGSVVTDKNNQLLLREYVVASR
jgi:hypothetical protein